MIKDYRIEAFSRPVSDLPDRPQISGAKLKEHFDSNSYELLAALNGLIEYLAEGDALSEMSSGGRRLDELLAAKVDCQDGKELSANDFTDAWRQKLDGLENYDDTAVKSSISDLKDEIAGLSESKVDKEEGKGLSANDYTDDEKNKIRVVWYFEIDEGIEDGLYFVMEKAPDDEGGYWGGYLLIQTHENTGEEFVYKQKKFDSYGVFERISYGDNTNFGVWENKADTTEVINSLESTSATSALSANMGRSLSLKIGAIEDVLDAIIALQESYIGGEGV